MQIHEQIYTSAIKLLDPSQSDLGVVAESAGFPRKVAAQLTALASYRLLEVPSVDDPKAHPSRIVAMPRDCGQSYSISRIVFAGADHSGRTTPLAHHILFAVQDLADYAVNLGDAVPVLKNLFMDDWNQSPQRYDPPRSIHVAVSDQSIHSIGQASSQRIANVIGWLAARFVDGLELSPSPVVFVLPTDQRDESLNLLAALYRAVAPAKQSSLIFQSHVSSSSDLIGQSHVLATYSNSDYLIELQSRPEKRRPPIIDLCDPLQTVFSNIGFANWFEKQLGVDASQQARNKGLRLRESLNDIDEENHPNGFSQVWEFYELLNMGNVMAHIGEIGQQSQTLASISPKVAGFVDKWTSAAIKNHFKQKQGDSDWQSFLQILISDTWPKPARKLCLEAIAEMPEFSFPTVLASRDAKAIAELVEKIDEKILTKPCLWEKLLQGVPQQSADCRRFLEGQVVSGKLSLSACQQLTAILITNGNSDQQQQAAKLFLTSPIQPQPIPIRHFEWLQSIESVNGLLQRLLDSDELPARIADSLREFLCPCVPAPSSATASSGFQLVIPNEQQAGTFAFKIRIKDTKTRQVSDPSYWIVYTAVILGLVTISGIGVIAWGKTNNDPKLSTPTSIASVAAAIISLLIAFVAYFLFDKNRTVSRQFKLMIFAFVSVALMVVSVIAVLASFVVPFVNRGAS
jgi:hypothetical protein